MMIQPPVRSCLVITKVPSGEASTIGKPTSARFGMLRHSYWQLPPDACAPHSMMCPVIGGPAKLVNQRSERETGVRCPAGDHGLRALVERFDQRRSAKVTVRAL